MYVCAPTLTTRSQRKIDSFNSGDGANEIGDDDDVDDINIDDDRYGSIDRGELISNAIFASMLTVFFWLVCFFRAGVYARDLVRRDRERTVRLADEIRRQAAERGNEAVI